MTEMSNSRAYFLFSPIAPSEFQEKQTKNTYLCLLSLKLDTIELQSFPVTNEIYEYSEQMYK